MYLCPGFDRYPELKKKKDNIDNNDNDDNVYDDNNHVNNKFNRNDKQ